MVKHGEELDQNGQSESENEHEANGLYRDIAVVLQLEVDLGDLDGQGGAEELEGECRH